MSEMREATRWWLWAVGMILLTVALFGLYNFLSTPARIAAKVTDPDHIIESYEEFQSIYNTTKKLCADLKALDVLEEGSTSGGFTKVDRQIALQQQINRWVQEYNAKSRMLTRNQWKNPNLPYQLSNDKICNDETN